MKKFAILVAALAIAVPGQALAEGGKSEETSEKHSQKQHKNQKQKQKQKGKNKNKPASYLFKGTVVSVGDVLTVKVMHGNSRGRAFKGQEVAFTVAKVSVADTNGDGVANLLDFVVGDKVVVQAKLPKHLTQETVQPFAARKAVNQTHPEVGEDEKEDESKGTTTPTPDNTSTTPVASF